MAARWEYRIFKQTRYAGEGTRQSHRVKRDRECTSTIRGRAPLRGNCAGRQQWLEPHYGLGGASWCTGQGRDHGLATQQAAGIYGPVDTNRFGKNTHVIEW